MDILKLYKKYKIIRLENNISANSLAKKSGLSKKTIYNIEAGCNVNIGNLAAYIGAIDYLVIS